MKVLLTGANGFVGSHLLDHLRAQSIPVSILLRPGSDRRLIAHQLDGVSVREGSLTDIPSLREALADVTHVIHCAGAVKALRAQDFFDVNQLGTRRLAEAASERPSQIRRILLLSSLAAHGPADATAPAREEDAPRPVSVYGRSKLAAEKELGEAWRGESVVVRPPGVYGPRDREFLRLFKAVRAHGCPGFGRQAFSLVYVEDLAKVVILCLTHPAAAGKTYHVAAPGVVTAREMAVGIARFMGVRTFSIHLPVQALWPVCAMGSLVAAATRRASMLSLWKYPELRAPGWVCDPSRMLSDLGIRCDTLLEEGIAKTGRWYAQAGWL